MPPPPPPCPRAVKEIGTTSGSEQGNLRPFKSADLRAQVHVHHSKGISGAEARGGGEGMHTSLLLEKVERPSGAIQAHLGGFVPLTRQAKICYPEGPATQVLVLDAFQNQNWQGKNSSSPAEVGATPHSPPPAPWEAGQQRGRQRMGKG